MDSIRYNVGIRRNRLVSQFEFDHETVSVTLCVTYPIYLPLGVAGLALIGFWLD